MIVSSRVTKPIGVLEPEVKLLSQNKNMIGQLQVLVPKNLMMMTVSDWIGANLLLSNQWKIQTMNSNWNGNFPKKKCVFFKHRKNDFSSFNFTGSFVWTFLNFAHYVSQKNCRCFSVKLQDSFFFLKE